MTSPASTAYRLSVQTLLILVVGANLGLLLFFLNRTLRLHLSGAIAFLLLVMILLVFFYSWRVRRALGTEATLLPEERSKLQNSILGFGPLGVLEVFLRLRPKKAQRRGDLTAPQSRNDS